MFNFTNEDNLEVSDEILMLRIRFWRDQQLTLCDWTQQNDSPLTATKKTKWADYRQELRDLPASNADVKKIVEPKKP
jgi:hypothetical protein